MSANAPFFPLPSVPLLTTAWLNGDAVQQALSNSGRHRRESNVGSTKANSNLQGKPLQDALGDLLPEPLSCEASRIIQQIVDLISSLMFWREAMRLALTALKDLLLPSHRWLKAVRLIAAELGAKGKSPRTVLRLLEPPKESKRRIAPPEEDGAAASGQRTVTSQLIERETKRVGRKIRSEASPESDAEFCARVVHRVQNRFQSGTETGRREAARLIQQLAKELDLSHADLLEAQIQTPPAASEAADRLPS